VCVSVRNYEMNGHFLVRLRLRFLFGRSGT
jgi:hypothetical protein